MGIRLLIRRVCHFFYDVNVEICNNTGLVVEGIVQSGLLKVYVGTNGGRGESVPCFFAIVCSHDREQMPTMDMQVQGNVQTATVLSRGVESAEPK